MPISGKHPKHFEGIQRSDSFSPQSVLPVLELRTGWTHFGLASLTQHDVCEMHQCCLGPRVPPAQQFTSRCLQVPTGPAGRWAETLPLVWCVSMLTALFWELGRQPGLHWAHKRSARLSSTDELKIRGVPGSGPGWGEGSEPRELRGTTAEPRGPRAP